MDPMEEFEFRPITDGLGFHQKSSEKNISKENPPTLAPLPPLGLKKEIVEPKETKDLFSQPTLPRYGDDLARTKIQAVAQSSTVEIPKFRSPLLSRKQNLDKTDINISDVLEKVQVQESKKVIEEIKSEMQECAPSFLSIFLDFTVISGISILFLMSLSIATKIDVISVFRNIGKDMSVLVAFVILVYAVAQFYMIISRSFFGQTLGEWSMDSEIGTKEQRQKISYIFKVTLRTWILAVTGLIVLPIISALTKKDVAGSFSGLKLYRR